MPAAKTLDYRALLAEQAILFQNALRQIDNLKRKLEALQACAGGPVLPPAGFAPDPLKPGHVPLIVPAPGDMTAADFLHHLAARHDGPGRGVERTIRSFRVHHAAAHVMNRADSGHVHCLPERSADDDA